MNNTKDDKILPQEFHFEDTADSVRVKTVVGKDKINQDTLVRHARHFRLGAGTIIKVQVMTKEYDVLLYSADFVIERAVETMKQIIDERGERTANVIDYEIVQDSEWKSYAKVLEPVPVVEEGETERYVPGEAEAKWNPGKKTYEIKIGDEVLATERDKDRAFAIAAGSEPLAA
ncbi:MAG TPA: hypothetical protein ENH62_15795 [Marinobacter sp.]|nr:hypothetical protein [Marinobacter sp.]